MLFELHADHPGVSRMRNLERSTVLWPGFHKEPAGFVKNYAECQLHKKTPPHAPLHPWEWSSQSWSRNNTCPFLGKPILVFVDSHSKWFDVVIVPSTSSIATFNVLRTIFAAPGLPEIIVSDNGTAFTSNEFQAFLRNNGNCHMRSAT